VEILSREDRGDYTLEKISIRQRRRRHRPRLFAFAQARHRQGSAILYCTAWREYEIGKENSSRPVTPPPHPDDPRAARLCVLAIDACCFGERNGRGPGGPDEKGSAGEMTASKFNLWVGRTLWGMMLRDDLMALDYLAARRKWISNRIGVTGMSLGATGPGGSWLWMSASNRRAHRLPDPVSNLIAHEGLKAHGNLLFRPQPPEPFRYGSHRRPHCTPARAVSGRRPGWNVARGRHPRHRSRRSPRLPALPKGGWPSKALSYPNQGHLYNNRDVEKTLAWFESNAQSSVTSAAAFRQIHRDGGLQLEPQAHPFQKILE